MQIHDVISETEHVGPYRWKDFVALPDDDKRELIDGYLIEIDVPNEIHEWIVNFLCYRLMQWGFERTIGISFASGYKVRISDTRGVMPDTQFFRKGGRPLGHQGLEEGAPDVAVEVISPSSGSYDRVKKLRWYESIGAGEYWLIDPVERTLSRYVLREGRYGEPQLLRDTEVFTPFEELSIQLSELWELPSWFHR